MRIVRQAVRLLLLLAMTLPSGCATPLRNADDLALRRGLHRAVIDGGPFALATYASDFRGGAPLTVYIEGDGYAWIDRFHPSDDPTPRNPVALEMASADPAPNLVYIARPCQYVEGADRRNCSPAYWTMARYAEEVIAATDRVIDHYKTLAGAVGVRLIGYSGGAAVAALLAERRGDVRELVTVAGVLDSSAWTAMRGTDPLSASLNPADRADRLTDLPQHHFVGQDDEVVPQAVTLSFLAHLPAGHRPRPIVIPAQPHEGGWAERWPALLGMIGDAR